MSKIRIGIVCPSEIALRRFMPAIRKSEHMEYIGVASASATEWYGEVSDDNKDVIANEQAKAMQFQNTYGGKIYNSYEALLKSEDIDAIYLPLPPALHFKWAKVALEYGKHVFLEKPSTTSLSDTIELVEIAKSKGLALHENYMFTFHNQIKEINDIVYSGKLGAVRLYRISFGFPLRAVNDFRYNKALGGGALLDCGGYTLKLAKILLGDTLEIVCSKLNYIDEFEVDIYGTATLVNSDGVTAQLAFGMDNDYKCDLEVWGSKGCLTTRRILTAPSEFVPTARIKTGNEEHEIKLSADDTFYKSIEYFYACIKDDNLRTSNYIELIKQSELVEKVKGE